MKSASLLPKRSYGLQSVLPEINLHTDQGVALHRQLVTTLKTHIKRGNLPLGSRLPPSREAAVQLKIGRNTVVDAYAELTALGLLESRGKQGTFVTPPPKLAKTQVAKEPRLIERLRTSASSLAIKLDWRLGQACIQLLPWAVWRAAAREAGRHLPPADYGDPRGMLALREAVATWLQRERGVVYTADQIVITQGTGQAIDLLARTLVRAGDHCVVETPGYLRAAHSLQAVGGVVSAIAVDAQGMDVAALEALPPASLIHITAAHQYPMGGRLGAARRRLLCAQVLRHQTLLIENEYDHEFIYTGQNFPPLAASLPQHAVLVSTFAKAVSPSLRLGFIAAPLKVADALAHAVELGRLHASWPIQCTMQWLLTSGELQKHLRRVRRHYASQRAYLLEQLDTHAPDIVVSSDEGGLHFALQHRQPQLTKPLIKELIRRDIQLQSADEFALTAWQPSHFFLAYGQMTQQDMDVSVKELKNALRAIRA
jgi:GntR family transcriptional regulator / MocR family aminotransferase